MVVILHRINANLPNREKDETQTNLISQKSSRNGIDQGHLEQKLQSAYS